MKTDDDEFFIGWQGRMPVQTGRRVGRITVAVALTAIAVASACAAWQRTIGRARWDYGHTREFSGVLLADPVPTLLLAEPERESGARDLWLVRPGKFGFDPAQARSLDGKSVRLRGSLLTRDGHAMLEVEPGSISPVAPGAQTELESEVVDLGEHALQGEIVDSKCFLGAMNPGVLKPHRACAILCISGGVPPVLLVRDTTGFSAYYLLVGPAGEAINREVLDFVAEPVEIRGRVQRRGGQLVLRARPEDIQRLP